MGASKTDYHYEWMARIRMKLNGEAIYGGGASHLLIKTDELGSLHAAAKEMEMSYRKALRIVKHLEAHFDRPFLKKAIGGAGGGGSELTDFARAFVYRFREMEDKVLSYTHSLADRYFSDAEMDRLLAIDKPEESLSDS